MEKTPVMMNTIIRKCKKNVNANEIFLKYGTSPASQEVAP